MLFRTTWPAIASLTFRGIVSRTVAAEHLRNKIQLRRLFRSFAVERQCRSWEFRGNRDKILVFLQAEIIDLYSHGQVGYRIIREQSLRKLRFLIYVTHPREGCRPVVALAIRELRP